MVSLVACTSQNPTQPSIPQPAGYTLVGSGSNGNAAVAVYANATLAAGYNAVYVQATVNGSPINGFVTLATTMNMNTMSHSCPIIQPTHIPDSSGLYHGAIVFTMAGTADEWKVTVNVHTNDGNITVIDVPVNVAASSNVKVVKAGNVKTIIAMLPAEWKVGKNDIEFAIFRGTDPQYPVLDQGTITMVPTMPSMGHGSYGNIHPTQQANLLYKGVVNYSMSGDWQIDVATIEEGKPTASVSFLVTVRQ